MKIIKNILTGLGVLLVLIIVLIIFLAGASSEFKEKHQEFVISYTKTLSEDWDFSTVSTQTTNDMLSILDTPNGRHAIRVFKSLGKLVEITDMELQNYSTHAGGPSVGIFKFKAHFKNANTLVTVTVHDIDGVAKVHSFHVDPISIISKPDEIQV